MLFTLRSHGPVSPQIMHSSPILVSLDQGKSLQVPAHVRLSVWKNRKKFLLCVDSLFPKVGRKGRSGLNKH